MPILQRCLVLVCLLGIASTLTAQDLFPSGTAGKAATVPSSLGCDGAACFRINPAAAEGKLITPYLELGYLRILYSYEHPNFDPVRVTVATPLASLGVLYGLPTLPLRLGVYFSPSGYGKQTINGLPRRIAGRFESLYVENESEVYDIAMGASYSLSSAINIGLGIIRRSEQRELYARVVGQEAALLRYEGRNVFWLPVLGMTTKITDYLELGLAYRAERSKHYKGRQKSAYNDDVTAPRNSSFDPRIVYTSLSLRPIQALTMRVNVNRYYHSRGRNKIRDGLTSDSSRADLHDIDERSIEFDWRLCDQWNLGVAYGITPSPWGPGKYAVAIEDQINGTDFGTPNNISRTAYAISSRYEHNEKINIAGAFYHSFGKREVGPNGDRPGFYQAEVLGISVALNYGF